MSGSGVFARIAEESAGGGDGGSEVFDRRRPSHQAEARKQGERELEAIVGVELELGQEIAQGDAEEGAGGERERDGRPARGCGWAELSHAEGEEGNAHRDHDREAEVDQVGPPPGDPRPEHQADDGQGVCRLVDDGRKEDAPARGTTPLRSAKSAAIALASATPPTRECTASPKAAVPHDKASAGP